MSRRTRREEFIRNNFFARLSVSLYKSHERRLSDLLENSPYKIAIVSVLKSVIISRYETFKFISTRDCGYIADYRHSLRLCVLIKIFQAIYESDNLYSLDEELHEKKDIIDGHFEDVVNYVKRTSGLSEEKIMLDININYVKELRARQDWNQLINL